MQGPHVFHVAYVFMVKRILDFLRVKNDGPNRILDRNHINYVFNFTDCINGVYVA